MQVRLQFNTTETVDKTACDTLLNYLTENKAWTIKGDSEDGSVLMEIKTVL